MLWFALHLAAEAHSPPASMPNWTLDRARDQLDTVLPAGNEGSVSPLWAIEDFRAARAQFGRRFGRELLPELLGASLERHYWVATFLAEPTYLRGDPPDVRLALDVLEDGLAKLPEVADPQWRVHLETKLRYLAALYADSLGAHGRAMGHKARLELLLTSAPEVAQASIPAVEASERAAYAAIGASFPSPSAGRR
jgi:hypothetical protein